MRTFGAIEAGGPKWVCAIADECGEILGSSTFATTSPDETIRRAVQFFRTHGAPSALGVGCFGPIDLEPSSSTFGRITTTPKVGWADIDVLSALRTELRIPIAIDTDVNAAALGEARQGNGRGLHTFSYLTVGTGIGLGSIVNRSLVRGSFHPESGHIRIPRDVEHDTFPGSCPYHGDCFEGLASGEAIRQRWGAAAEDLDAAEVWELEADYLAVGLLSIIHILAPQRIVVGGGVATHEGLLPRVRTRIRELAAGYLQVPELVDPTTIDTYVVTPGLGRRSGVMGAVELAKIALEHHRWQEVRSD